MAMEIVEIFFYKSLVAIIPSVAFAILFTVPKKYLIWVAIGGYVAFLSKSLSIAYLGCGPILSTFIGSVAISLLYIYIGPKLRTPRQVFTVASIIPLIPGKFAYTTMMSLIQFYNMETGNHDAIEYIQSFYDNGLITACVMLAIGFGIALPPLFFYRNRPVV